MKSKTLKVMGTPAIRLFVFTALMFSLVATLAPAVSTEASLTICREAQVLSAEGICVAKSLDLNGGLLGNQGTQHQSSEGGLLQNGNLGNLLLTPTPQTDQGDGNGDQTEGPVVQQVENLDVVGDGYLTIHKYSCEGSDDWPGKDLDELRAACSVLQGVEFDLRNIVEDGSTDFQHLATTDADGLAFWTIPQPHQVLVDEAMPEGYVDPIVYCGVVAGPDSGLGLLSLVDSAGGVIQQSLRAGQQLYCDWFNVLPPHVEDPIIQVPFDGGYLTIQKQACPTGYDAYAADYYDLALNCAEPLEGVEFLVSNGDVILRNGATDGQGYVDLGKVPAAPLSVVEVVPAGFGEPVVYCESFSPDNLQGTVTRMPIDAGNQFLHIFGVDEELHCNWYNVPGPDSAGDEDDGTVTVIKLVCPEESGETPKSLVLETPPLLDFGPRQHSPEPGDPEPCSEFELEPGVDFTFNASLDGQDLGSKQTGADGKVEWTDLATGELSLSEEIPAGYGQPFFHCTYRDYTIFEGFAGVATMQLPHGDVICYVINVPDGHEDGDGIVQVFKWECEQDPGASDDLAAHFEAAGCVLIDDVKFTLFYGIDSAVTKFSGDAGPGETYWQHVPAGQISILEAVPVHYGEPVVYCTSEMPKAVEQVLGVQTFTGDQIETELDEGEWLRCHWVNIPEDDNTTITIYKYTCPAGYDVYGAGANPEYDCTDLTDGILFELYGEGDYDAAYSGDSGPGGVTWGNRYPGSYQVMETPPAGTQYAFVYSCEGASVPMIQNYPLSYGFALNIDVASGDSVVCTWFNVPEPEWGTVTVIKYACETTYFISPDDCEIYETGAEFTLFRWTGAEGYLAGDGVTNGAGVLSWHGLPGGYYEIDEVGREWCYAESNRSDADGKIEVIEGEETVVWVYNCGVKTPLKQPTKYPNTGVGSSQATLAASPAPVSEQGAYEGLMGMRLTGVLDSRIAATFAGFSKPARIEIESIDLVAEIEILEIVDGKFQDPTTSDKVAWYRDTARPGEAGNVVMAGHLNYWGDPEGVFYDLDKVQIGDIVALTSADGVTHRYQVISAGQVEATAETLRSIAAQTELQTLTLITCGGQWDPSIQSYLHRTVVKAVQID